MTGFDDFDISLVRHFSMFIKLYKKRKKKDKREKKSRWQFMCALLISYVYSFFFLLKLT